MEERKITLVDDDQTLEFYVVEETKLNGANYLLVTDAEDDDEEGDIKRVQPFVICFNGATHNKRVWCSLAYAFPADPRNR